MLYLYCEREREVNQATQCGGGEMTWREERAKITDALIISIDSDIETILKKINYLNETIKELRKKQYNNANVGY